MSHRVEFSPEALGDLIDLYDYIALRDGAERAIGYIDRIEECCLSLSVFPDSGVRRDDLRPSVRILGFERRAQNRLNSTEAHFRSQTTKINTRFQHPQCPQHPSADPKPIPSPRHPPFPVAHGN